MTNLGKNFESLGKIRECGAVFDTDGGAEAEHMILEFISGPGPDVLVLFRGSAELVKGLPDSMLWHARWDQFAKAVARMQKFLSHA